MNQFQLTTTVKNQSLILGGLSIAILVLTFVIILLHLEVREQAELIEKLKPQVYTSRCKGNGCPSRPPIPPEPTDFLELIFGKD
ncbi:hypothetical protein [Pseudoalteromonas rubra]|uniref:hypothetical protein n=1 Tax=Pseudoalteromonas rubra TaxID=43658 RepID=UPI002DBA1CF0|nr:hypothetical protein [Pseudoalteromonas rubra]MEC4091600.1 hypothetical protein [Pseudoalteromonas rubra]